MRELAGLQAAFLTAAARDGGSTRKLPGPRKNLREIEPSGGVAVEEEWVTRNMLQVQPAGWGRSIQTEVQARPCLCQVWGSASRVKVLVTRRGRDQLNVAWQR